MIATAIGTAIGLVIIGLISGTMAGLFNAGMWSIYRRVANAPAVKISEWIYFYLFWYAVFGAIAVVITLIGALTMAGGM